MFIRFQFASTIFAELVRDRIARSDVGCIRPTGSGFVVERIEFPPASSRPMDVDRSGDLVVVDPDRIMAMARSDPGQAAPPGGAAGPTIVSEPATAGGHAAASGLRIRWPDTLPFPTGFESITIPVAGGSPISVQRQRLLLTLPITLHVRTVDQLITDTGEPFVVTIDVLLRVDLVHLDGGDDVVRVAYHGVGHREGNDPAIEQLIRSELAAANIVRDGDFPYTSAVLDALRSLSGGGGEVGEGGEVATPTVVWSGMTLTPDRQAVELRVEVSFDDAGGTADPDAWRQFLGRQVDDYRTGHDWAIEIVRDLLDASATAGAEDQVAKIPGFDLAGTGPHVEWRPDFPGFRTTFTGEIIDACSCFGVEIDLNVAVEVRTKLALAAAGTTATIEVDSVATGDATHAGEQACCAITGALFFPILGWVYLEEGKIGWGGLALGMYVPIWGGFLTMLLLFDPSVDVPLAEGCHKDGDHQICRHEFSLNPEVDPCVPPAATISLDLLRGRNNGLVLAGAVDQVVRTAPQVSASRPTPFDWRGPQPTCTGTVGEWSAVSTFGVVQVDGGFPLEVCDEVIPLGPAAPIYRARVASRTECPSSAVIEVTTLPWTPGNPDPQPILVLTNVGAMLVMAPPLPALTEDERQAHDLFVARWRLLHCGIFDPDLVDRTGRIEARWSIDTPAGREPTRRLWVIRAGGLEPGERLVVSDGASGDELASGESDRRSGVRLDLLHDGADVHITRRRPDGGTPGPMSQAKVSITQLLLHQVDEHHLDAPADALRLVDDPARLAIEVLSGDRREILPLDPSGRIAVQRLGWSAPVMPDSAPPAPGRPRRGIGWVADGEVSDGVRRALAAADEGEPVDPDAWAFAATMNRWRWVVRAPAGGFLEVDDRAGQVTNRYRARPWLDGLVHVAGVFARLDDDRSTLRTFRVGDTLSL